MYTNVNADLHIECILHRSFTGDGAQHLGTWALQPNTSTEVLRAGTQSRCSFIIADVMKI